MKTKEEALLELIKSSFHITINLNDCFYWACSDSSEIDGDDVEDLIPYIQEYGVFEVVMAYESIKRRDNPEHKEFLTKTFFKLKKEFYEKMNTNSNFLPSLNYQYKKENDQIKKYGGILDFRFEDPTPEQKANGQHYLNCIVSVRGKKTQGIGSNMMEAEENLKKILGV